MTYYFIKNRFGDFVRVNYNFFILFNSVYEKEECYSSIRSSLYAFFFFDGSLISFSFDKKLLV